MRVPTRRTSQSQFFRLAALPTGTEKIHRLHEEIGQLDAPQVPADPGADRGPRQGNGKHRRKSATGVSRVPDTNPSEPLPRGRHGGEECHVSKRHDEGPGHPSPAVQEHRDVHEPGKLGARKSLGVNPRRGRSPLLLQASAQGNAAGAPDRAEDALERSKAKLEPPVKRQPELPGGSTSGRGPRGIKRREAAEQPAATEGPQREVKRKRTKREIEMVIVPDDVEGPKLGPLKEILSNHDSEDEQGRRMRDAGQRAQDHPQVRQYYDEVKSLLTGQEQLKEAMQLFHSTVVEYLDQPIEKLIDELHLKFQPLVEDCSPSERSFFATLGWPWSATTAGAPGGGAQGGVEIRVRTPERNGEDGGVFVGRSTPSLPGSILQEEFGGELNALKMRRNLLWRPLYINNGETELAHEVIDRYNLEVDPSKPRVPWRDVWHQGRRRS